VRYDLRSLSDVRTIRAYDRLVIAPMHGFASAEDYYVRASAGPLLGRLALPTLLIHAEDDPLVPARTVHPWVDAAPPALLQHWTDRGGHVGWIAGLGESAWIDTWAMRRALEFLRVTWTRVHRGAPLPAQAGSRS
jgi:predicted alpha/beta-fold hydrolase